MTEHRRLVIDRPGVLQVVAAAPGPPPEPGEALVHVAYAGVCGSDREVVAGTRDPRFVRYPVVPGHEWSGTVVELGPGVDAALLGRQVVGESIRHCGTCPACRGGATNLCHAGYDETGFTRPGACADLLRLPARLLHTLPDGADLRAAALIEPAACVAEAVLLAALEPGERVAVVGGGTLGLLATQLLAAGGPAELVVVDPRSRPAAAAAGAGEVCTPEQAAARRAGFDVVVETAGARGSGRLAVGMTRRGGRVVLTGLFGGLDDPLPPAELVAAAVTVHTVFGAPSRAWTHAVHAFTTGVLRPSPLVSDELDLEDAARALVPGAPVPTGKVLLRT